MAFPTSVNNQITDAVAPAAGKKKKSRKKITKDKSAKKSRPAKKARKTQRKKK